MGPLGPVRDNLGPLGPVRDNLGPLGPVREENLGPLGPVIHMIYRICRLWVPCGVTLRGGFPTEDPHLGRFFIKALGSVWCHPPGGGDLPQKIHI